MGKRTATPEEARALANPLRIRILRLCLDESLTNKQIAASLGRDPGSTLHHVRLLVATGFLVAEPVRSGERGALEKPYRSTGKTWDLSIDDAATEVAIVDAFREELAEAGRERLLFMSRMANRLNEASFLELKARIESVIDEFGRREDADGVRMAFFLAGHTREESPQWATLSEPGD